MHSLGRGRSHGQVGGRPRQRQLENDHGNARVLQRRLDGDRLDLGHGQAGEQGPRGTEDEPEDGDEESGEEHLPGHQVEHVGARVPPHVMQP